MSVWKILDLKKKNSEKQFNQGVRFSNQVSTLYNAHTGIDNLRAKQTH